MSTIQKFLPWDNSSQANFDAWVEGIHSALVTTCGWVQTADTGQAANNPSVPSSAYVYRTYKPNDALQTGASQFFLKIQFGFSTTTVQASVQVGTGLDGAGNLTGFVSTAVLFPNNTQAANYGSTPYECNFSGDSGRFGAMMFRNNPSASAPANWGFFIERTLNVDGTPNALGVVVICANANTGGTGTSTTQTLLFGVGPGNQRGVIALSSQVSGGDSFNNSIPMSPVFPDAGLFGYPQTVVAMCSAADVAEGALVPTTMYGAPRVYLAAKRDFAMGRFGPNIAQNTNALLMRYD